MRAELTAVPVEGIILSIGVARVPHVGLFGEQPGSWGLCADKFERGRSSQVKVLPRHVTNNLIIYSVYILNNTQIFSSGTWIGSFRRLVTGDTVTFITDIEHGTIKMSINAGVFVRNFHLPRRQELLSSSDPDASADLADFIVGATISGGSILTIKSTREIYLPSQKGLEDRVFCDDTSSFHGIRLYGQLLRYNREYLCHRLHSHVHESWNYMNRRLVQDSERDGYDRSAAETAENISVYVKPASEQLRDINCIASASELPPELRSLGQVKELLSLLADENALSPKAIPGNVLCQQVVPRCMQSLMRSITLHAEFNGDTCVQQVKFDSACSTVGVILPGRIFVPSTHCLRITARGINQAETLMLEEFGDDNTFISMGTGDLSCTLPPNPTNVGDSDRSLQLVRAALTAFCNYQYKLEAAPFIDAVAST
jgi:hypothetical protein